MHTKGNLLKRAEKFIIDNKLIEKGDTVIVALSGGADSVCLLCCLNALKEKYEFDIKTAHLNHMIRGEEAKRDEDFARALSEKLKVEFFSKSVNIPLISHGQNVEEKGREERYKFFRELSQKYPRSKIAVAHNSNDLTETVVMRLMRGSSVFGLSGIKSANGDIIRPLIFAEREEIEEFLSENGASFITDSSNLEDEYTRNRIRHKIIPEMKKINPDINKAIERTAKNMLNVSDFIKIMASEQYGKIDNKLNTEKLLSLHKALSEFVISEAAYKAGMKEISYCHIDAIYNLAKGQSGKRIELTKGYEAIKIYSEVVIKKKKESKDYIIELNLGENIIGETGYKITIAQAKKGIDADKVSLPLYARPRKSKDVLNPVGMTGSKKVQDIYIDDKLSIDKRDSYPVILDGEKVIFAKGRCDRSVVSNENTKKAYKITISEGESAND